MVSMKPFYASTGLKKGLFRSILHDPVEYPEPELFKPERFLHPDGSLNDAVQDPSIACFGFGRR